MVLLCPALVIHYPVRGPRGVRLGVAEGREGSKLAQNVKIYVFTGPFLVIFKSVFLGANFSFCSNFLFIKGHL